MPTSGASDPSDFLPTPTPTPPPRAPVAKLVIEEPRLQDEALYKCDVTYVKGKCPSISLVRLQMMALPERAQIFTLPNELAGESPLKGEASAPGQVIGPLNELDQLQLACLIRGGRPAPKAAFWRKIDPTGRTINLPLASQQHTVIAGGGENGNPTTNGNNNNKLRQSQADELAALKVTLNHTLTSDDLGAKFECHVEHEALDAMRPMARVISTKPPLAPGPDAMLDLHPAASSSINRHDDGGGEHSSLDEDGEMQAGAESMALAAHVLPSLDSHVIVDLNVGVSSLDLFLTKHTAGSQHQQSQAGQRNASEPLHEGDLIELECVAYNSKPAANITWLNGQDAIGASDQTGGVATTARSVKQPAMQTEHRALRQRRLLQRNQVQLNPDGLTYNTHSFLSIKLSRHEHRAQISCQAQNGARSASRQQPLVKSIELQVQHAPIVLMEPAAGIVVNEFATPPVIPDTSNQRQLDTQQQQQVQIYCIYSANPLQLAPNSVRWFKDGQPLDVHKSQAGRLVESLTPSTGYPVLTIRQPNRADAGRYDCQLANSLGTSERLAPSEACKLEVNFRPSVQLRLLKETTTTAAAGQVEFDAERELVLPGDELVLACQVLEAQPNKITSYHWFARPLSSPAGDANGSNQRQWPRPPATSRPLAVTEGPRYRLPAMRANFTPTAYACLASNAIGQSEPSEPIDLQLSHTPGPSRVRPIADALLRKIILSSGGKAPAAHPVSAGGAVIDPTATAGPKEENIDMEKPMSAGRELLLECLTQDLGRPRANIWLWFKDGQTIESSSRHQQEEQQQRQQPSRLQQDEVERIDSTAGSNNNNNLESKSDFILKDNPISDRLHDLSPANSVAADQPPPQVFGNDNVEQQQQRAAVGHRQHTSPRLLGSGRYLFIPSIQLAHRGNYSCVAVNRLGTGSSFAPTATHSADRSGNGRDSYQLKVALAPSFIQPLPTRTYWAETTAASPSSSANNNNNNDVANPSQSNGNEQLELVCRVQCEPICHIEWLRNNEPIDMLKRNDSSDNNNGHTSGNNYVSYHARHTIMDENEAANVFRSIESKLVLSFHGLARGEQQRTDTSSKRVLLDRDKLLERRHFLNNSNFTCRSSANSMGGPVKSTTIFSVQYPPENVLISVPSDKLNLVEGSNGPLLSCEASGLPQVQYRWLLLRSGNNIITSSDLVAARYNTRHFGSGPAAGTGQVQSGIANNNKQDAAGDGSGGQRPRTPRAGSQHNDAASTILQQLLTAEASSAQPAAQRFVELTGLSSGEQVGSSTMISTLDLSNISIDRKQAGHYICEASNELGETRQSVYVNVLYKPTCTTLHMHSLDSTGSLLAQETQDTRHRGHHSAGENEESPVTKPFGASAQDEYALVRESSGDFIDLRRVLVMSPMLNRLTSAGLSTDQQQQQLEGDKLSFSGSIFGAILDASRSRGVKLSSPLNDGVALHHDDLSNSISSASLEMDSGDASSDSWAKFNSILLKFLNNHSRQIRQEEDRRVRSAASASRRTQQTRRSSSSSSSSSANTNSFGTIDESAIVNAGTGEATERQLAPPGSDRQQTSHLLTFACMAQEGNPMQNLTFDWHFGAMRLPHVNQTGASDHNNNVDGNYYLPTSSGPSDEQRPLLIYGNKNSTLTVLMTRRLDTKTMLNPFQMSLLTIKVISSNSDLNFNGAQQLDGTNSTSEELLMRAPVIRSRYQSLYSQPKAGDSAQLARQQRNNNIQFGQEHAQANDEIDLDAFNWQHRLGALLSCSVANSIGPSEPSYVRVNVAGRLGKSGIAADAASNSLYEFAKWRMPSLAQKSLLIISLLIGCSLIVFATFALLIGPHLRALHFLHKSQQCCASGGASSGSGSSKTTTDETGTNTGQSTSSQKSSVLGLLGNGGDLSFPSSSDDDTSARLNQLDSGLIVANGGIVQMAVAHQHQNTNLGLQRRAMLVESQQHKSIDDSVNYDQPRNIMTTNTHQARLIYQPDGGNFDATGLTSTYVNYQFHDDNANSEQLMGTRHRKSSTSSTSSKILASLRLNPFSRAKIQDRLSDLPSITGRLTSLHNRNVSSSETATTGVSIDVNSAANLRGYQNFGNMPANLRHSYAGGRRAPLASHYAQGPSLMHRDFYTQDEATSSRLMQLNSQALRVNQSSTLMSAHHQRRPPLNAMDEFMRVRGLDTTTTNTTGFDELDDEDTLATTYGSQSIRNQSSTLYSLRNDLAAQHQRNNIKPPVFPRNNAHHQSYATSTMYKRPPPPPIAARTLQQQQQQLHYHHQGQSGSTVNNFAAPMYPISSAPYGESFIMQGQQQPMSMNPFAGYNQHIAYANTFDTRNPYDNYEDQPVEHIYDVNAYATPEQTPLRSGNNDSNKLDSTNKSERPRVSQLIQTFDSKLPDQSPC